MAKSRRRTSSLRCGAVALLFFSSLLLTTQAWADAIVITSGYMDVPGSGAYSLPDYNLIGDGFWHTGRGGDPGNTPSCTPCSAGSAQSLNAYLAGSSLAGTTLYNGTTYTVPSLDRG